LFYIIPYFLWFALFVVLFIIAWNQLVIVMESVVMGDENRAMMQQMVREFAHKHIRPHVMEWDEAQLFPIDTFKAMGQLGIMGVLVPEEYGGAGLGYDEYVDVIVEVARVCGSIGLSLAAH